jgi:hypothetical protein
VLFPSFDFNFVLDLRLVSVGFCPVDSFFFSPNSFSGQIISSLQRSVYSVDSRCGRAPSNVVPAQRFITRPVASADFSSVVFYRSKPHARFRSCLTSHVAGARLCSVSTCSTVFPIPCLLGHCLQPRRAQGQFLAIAALLFEQATRDFLFAH